MLRSEVQAEDGGWRVAWIVDGGFEDWLCPHVHDSPEGRVVSRAGVGTFWAAEKTVAVRIDPAPESQAHRADHNGIPAVFGGPARRLAEIRPFAPPDNGRIVTV